MRLYLAGERSADAASYASARARTWEGRAKWLQHVRRRLFSYYYHGKNGRPSEDIMVSHELGLDLFLDSGAFTAFTQKKELDLKAYAKFVVDSQDVWTTCSSLDHIGRGEEAAVKSYENYQRLLDLGARVQPVFHVREPDHWLERYIDEGTDYLFIGAMVPESTSWLIGRLDELWGKYLTNPDGTARIKVHGFGLTTFSLMLRYPWYSVDSTSWLSMGMYGHCNFLTPDKRLIMIDFTDQGQSRRRLDGPNYRTLSPHHQREVDALLAEVGVSAEELIEHYAYRDAVNAYTYQNLELLAVDRFIRPQETLL